MTPPPPPVPREKRKKGFFLYEVRGNTNSTGVANYNGRLRNGEKKNNKKNTHAFSMWFAFWFQVVFMQHVFFLPFLFLWFSLISSRIKGFRWVSLISFSSSKHCLPPRTTAAQVLLYCQICREGRISYSRTNLTSKRGRSTEGADKRRGPFWPTVTCSVLYACFHYTCKSQPPGWYCPDSTERDYTNWNNICVLTLNFIVFMWVASSTHLSTQEFH